MALAQVTVWVPGQVLTAAALNSEFTNILNNPISLLSPTTGVINFNLQAHTNLVPSAVSASSGTAGQALIVSTAATPSAVWGAASPGVYTSFSSGDLLIGTSSGNIVRLAIGSTGQVLAVTSSNTTPAWQVIPLSGGLTSGTVSTGTLLYVSSSGVLTPLAIGTSGQVLTVTSSLPAWAASGGGAAVPTVVAVRSNVSFGGLTTSPADVTGSTMVFSLSNNLRRVLIQGGPTYASAPVSSTDATLTVQIATSSGILVGSPVVVGPPVVGGAGDMVSWSYAFSPATTLSRTYVVQAFTNVTFTSMTIPSVIWSAMEVSSS